MNIIESTFGKIGNFFHGIGTSVSNDYRGVTKTASNDVSTVEKDVKVVMWIAIILFVVYIFGGRR
jgi:hypothetical protein